MQPRSCSVYAPAWASLADATSHAHTANTTRPMMSSVVLDGRIVVKADSQHDDGSGRSGSARLETAVGVGTLTEGEPRPARHKPKPHDATPRLRLPRPQRLRRLSSNLPDRAG